MITNKFFFCITLSFVLLGMIIFEDTMDPKNIGGQPHKK